MGEHWEDDPAWRAAVEHVRETLPNWSPSPPGVCQNCQDPSRPATRTARESWPIALGHVRPLELCARCFTSIARNLDSAALDKPGDE